MCEKKKTQVSTRRIILSLFNNYCNFNYIVYVTIITFTIFHKYHLHFIHSNTWCNSNILGSIIYGAQQYTIGTSDNRGMIEISSFFSPFGIKPFISSSTCPCPSGNLSDGRQFSKRFRSPGGPKKSHPSFWMRPPSIEVLCRIGWRLRTCFKIIITYTSPMNYTKASHCFGEGGIVDIGTHNILYGFMGFYR